MTAAGRGEAKVEHRRVEESVASLPPHQRPECQGWVVIKRGRIPLTARLLHTGCSRCILRIRTHGYMDTT